MSASTYVIILNYNNYLDTIECVTSLFQNVDMKDVTVVIVDNSSTIESYNHLKNNSSDKVMLLKSDHNWGYANGNNIGIKYAIDNNAKYICILNNDVVVTEDFLTPCIRVLNQPNTGFVSPRITDYHTSLIQNTGGKVFIEKGCVDRINGDKQYTNDIPEIIDCDVVYGSCLLLKSSLIKRVGLIPEEYFLFFEETDWCYKAHTLSYINRSVTGVTVFHKGGASTASFKKSGLVSYLYDRNQVLFTKKYLTKFGLVRFVVYDILRTLYYNKNNLGNLKSRLSNRLDGLTGKVAKQYDYIYVGRHKCVDKLQG